MPGQKITIKDVAERSGVSVATVSRVLNDNYFVTSDIKQKVLKAVDELGYIPNSIARSLKMNTSGIIGYITSDISNGYHIMIAKAIEDIIKPNNYNLIVCSTGNDKDVEERYLKLLLGKSIDALVLNTCGKNDSFILHINKTLPMVLVNRRLNTPGFHGDFADCNNDLGMYLLTKELTDKGHRKILLMEGPPNLSNTKERFNGFQKAMEEIGIDVTKNYPFRYEGDYSLKSGYEGIKFMQNLPLEPTAVLATNNAMTLGALKALKEFQIPVPDQISIAGFNGIDNLELMTTRPTVADYDPYKIGLAAGKAILERIEDNTIDNREYIFSPTMIHGNAIIRIS
ncbi:substrate-binding domain-containing protein [Anaerocolumna sedimenticola]|uniref:Substrate-binding domain-containing protein n=1 Tax=Anaerocolumna sedimenticola TaxID=2696063 RepID=A0A6P1TET2_9FIRM|nr:LacI family DNA-binding transcriptional regulator [Anaerocolumna sedimenticola]QHQ59664.1 substrate-binding domain-containing protein [Anaerocolumna sedimenticola]